MLGLLKAPWGALPPGDAPPSTFSIADVPVVASSKATHMNLAMVNHDRLLVHHATMVDMLAFAYGIDRDKVFGGPSWIDKDRHEIAALAQRDTLFNGLRLMPQGLLADRFKLVMRTEDRPQPAYLMTAPKGATGIKSRMRPSDGSGTPGCTSPPLPPDTRPAADTPVTFTCRGESMKDFAAFMAKFVQFSFVPPVVDATGIKGSFDFDIQLPIMQPRNSPETTALLKAVETIGLEIAPGTAPQPATVVASVNETPTPNPPGIEAALPPLRPAEFEVATIKPTAPGGQGMFNLSGDGVVDLRGLPMRWPINFAWGLNGDQTIANPPKWLDELNFYIKAKLAVPDTGAGPAATPQVDFEEVAGLLRKMLEERFAIKSHMEDRSLDAYALLADNPKMKTADPQFRSGCKEGPGPNGKDPRIAQPILGRLISCQNTTMAQFTEVLEAYKHFAGFIKDDWKVSRNLALNVGLRWDTKTVPSLNLFA